MEVIEVDESDGDIGIDIKICDHRDKNSNHVKKVILESDNFSEDDSSLFNLFKSSSTKTKEEPNVNESKETNRSGGISGRYDDHSIIINTPKRNTGNRFVVPSSDTGCIIISDSPVSYRVDQPKSIQIHSQSQSQSQSQAPIEISQLLSSSLPSNLITPIKNSEKKQQKNSNMYYDDHDYHGAKSVASSPVVIPQNQTVTDNQVILSSPTKPNSSLESEQDDQYIEIISNKQTNIVNNNEHERLLNVDSDCSNDNENESENNIIIFKSHSKTLGNDDVNTSIYSDVSDFSLASESNNEFRVSNRTNSLFSSIIKPPPPPFPPQQDTTIFSEILEKLKSKSESKTHKTTITPIELNKDEEQLEKLFNENPKLVKELNKKRTKDEILSEMIISFESNLYDSLQNLSKSSSTNLENDFNPITIKKFIDFSKLPIIQWQRKSNKRFYSKRGVFVPINDEITYEQTIAIYIPADKLVAKLYDETISQLINDVKISHGLKTKRKIGTNLIVLVDGLESYLTKIKNARNREFKKSVLSNLQDDDDDDNLPSKRRRKTPEKSQLLNYDVDEIRKKIMELEVFHNSHIFIIKGYNDLKNWLFSFSYALGSNIYDKLEIHKELSNLSGVKSGISNQDTYIQILKQIKFVTESTAKKVQQDYPDIKSLVLRLQNTDKIKQVRSNVESQLRKIFTTENENDFLI
ncbi:hypothetical protein BVG19_g5381 [[Candida] boidinii]|nr:hypothetical protein BVG19_g5381 [[Candida] boidinii]OWB51673.1 hypothetical protein B5S27_g3238 [[Candida] boidinii]